MRILGLASALIFTAGCVTNIATLPITAEDRMSYDNGFLTQISEQSSKVHKVAVVPELENIKDPVKKKLSEQFRGVIEAALTSYDTFDPVPRSEITAVLQSNKFNSMIGSNGQAKLVDSDYLLVYSITSYYMSKKGDVVSKLLESSVFNEGYRAIVKAKISLINSKTGKKEVSKTVTGKSSNRAETSEITPGSSNIGLLAEGVEDAANRFISLMAIEYDKPAIVLQTKGSGQVAMLNIGENSGIMLGSDIEFFEMSKVGGRKIVIPFAYGKVLEVRNDMCWVEVQNYSNAAVRKNHFARIRAIH